jgi:hypothetical protein
LQSNLEHVNVSVKKKNESAGGSPAVSLKARLQEVQQTLNAVRSHIRHHGFTPEQVFGYEGKADASNLKDEVAAPARVRPAAKKAAPKKAAAAKRAAKSPPIAEKTPPVASIKTALNPASAWPFPTGSRP